MPTVRPSAEQVAQGESASLSLDVDCPAEIVRRVLLAMAICSLRTSLVKAGLCGGSYYRREAILDALSDERVAEIDWMPRCKLLACFVTVSSHHWWLIRLAKLRNYLGEKFSKEIYSSDFALQYALAARGWTIMPWEEAAQMHNDKAH